MSASAIRIAALVRLVLGSDKDGEILGAVEALKRTLAAAGLDHHRLAEVIEAGLPKPAAPEIGDDWRALARFCQQHIGKLTPKEAAFVATLARYKRPPSEKQVGWLISIAGRLRDDAEDAA